MDKVMNTVNRHRPVIYKVYLKIGEKICDVRGTQN